MAPQTPETGAQPVVVEPPSTSELVESAVATWRAALVEAAGGSTLAEVDLLGDGPLDLSAAHPSGIAQLFAGRDTRLSNLVREGGALSAAKRRARAVGSRADEYAQRYGIAPTYLSIGVASWTERTSPDVATDDVAALAAVTRPRPHDGPVHPDDEPHDDAWVPPQDAVVDRGPRTVRAPVLVRPVSLRARGSGESDYELALEPSLEVNPVLARALRARGALLDPAALARGAFTASGFDPRPALDRLAALGAAVLEDFRLSERLLVGTFVHPGQVLVEDLDQQSATLDHHEVIAALAGDEAARSAVARDLPDPVAGDRHPDHERGVGDLDPAQQHVLDVLALGAHLFIDAPAGCDVRGTVAAVVADAAASGRSVLYVPGHRRAAAALGARMSELGVDDLLLDVAPEPGWRAAAARRLLTAMTLQDAPVDGAHVATVRRELVDHRDRLRRYVTALHEARRPWDVSPYDALQALARLTSARPAPQTTVRLASEVVGSLTRPRDRERHAADLGRAARLGAFSLRPVDTPWFDADLTTDAAAQDTMVRIERLLSTGLPGVVERARDVAVSTGLTPATTVAGWGEQLRMLAGIRGALDVFQPMIFERSAADLVAATAGRAWRAEHGVTMSGVHRRRLRKQAKDMVRPGRPVADLHAALVDVQEQREIWQAHCPAGGWPRLPDGLADIEAEYAVVQDDVEHVARVLASTPAGGALAAVSFADLVERLRRLLVDRRALETLPERTAALRALRGAGLDPLLQDLAHRRVAPGLVGAELELAWWSSVFEELLRGDPALAGYDGAALTGLAAEFRRLDLEHVASLSGPVRASVARQVGDTLLGHRERARALFGELNEERLTSLREVTERYPDLVRRLRPVVTASPMLVPQLLPATRTVDLVVLDAVQHLPLELLLSAIARGRQVVVVGDPRCASGTAVRELAEVLPRVALRASATRRDPYLTAFLADHGYAGVLEATPLPHAAPLVHLDVVPGSGMPDPGTGAVESTREEVEHVVELVITHALTRPEESLAVITPSSVHAARVREAVLGEVRDNPALAAFFDARRAEPFVSTDLAGVAGLRREAVILSLGYGRTPHGRVLHRFGPLSGPGGEALLLDALGAIRHRLTVVSCFALEDLDPERLRGPGARLLGDLLGFAAERGRAPEVEVARRPAVAGEPGTRDRLVTDLAERLWRAGLVVQVEYGVAGGARIPLAVGHPDLPDEMLVAVLTDDEAYVAEPSVRVRDRQVPQRLERLGWRVVQVWSAAAFLDPQAEAEAIERAVLACLAERPTAPPEPLQLADDVDGDLGHAVPAPVVDAAEAGPVTERVPTATAPVRTAQGAPPVPPQSETEPESAAGSVPVLGSEPVSELAVAPEPEVEPEPEPALGSEPVPRTLPRPAPVPTPGSTPLPTPDPVPTPHPLPPTEARVAAPPVDLPPIVLPPVELPPAEPTGPRPDQGTGAPTRDVEPPSSADATGDVRPAPAGRADRPEPDVSEPAAPAPAPARPSTRRGRAVMPSIRATPARPFVDQPRLPVRPRPRPAVPAGLPITAYGDDQLDEVATWIMSDGVPRAEAQLDAALRAELGLTRRGVRVDAAVAGAVRRALR
ncbi:hypothetical protein [Cellulomonas aerilata]|uniref:hypothetical protein n=1 Tax=Cellulomonas aerilata TaxID=515326 RepID=UPI0011BDDFFB|nr:hypothetical protein [Cellulomonas aerilata]